MHPARTQQLASCLHGMYTTTLVHGEPGDVLTWGPEDGHEGVMYAVGVMVMQWGGVSHLGPGPTPDHNPNPNPNPNPDPGPNTICPGLLTLTLA